MKKIVGLMLWVLGTAAVALAVPIPPAAPEIDAGSAMSALALISGAALVLRGRRK